MRLRFLIGWLLVGGGLPVLTHAADPADPPPCSIPESRQFDFWAGDWDVTSADGKRKAGHNRIEPVLGGCALHESWTGASGFRGNSYSSYDRSRGVWHQTWVDVGGTVLLLEGGLRDGAMVLEGDQPDADGPVRNRITWTPNADGTVRQHWQVSKDDGGHWKSVFDGIYHRSEAGTHSAGAE
ncbi:MAG: hypothetical protein PHP86_09165 [Nevskiales bacterium]|nr:hypothetical protein [Nevskiales bacterium]